MARTANTTATRRKPRAKTAVKDDPQAETAPESTPKSTPNSTPNSATAEGAKSGGGGWVIALIAFSLIAGAGYLTQAKWMPLVADKFPKLPSFTAEDPRVTGLNSRIAALESKTGDLTVKDETIQRLEIERGKLSEQLGKALARLETVEKSMAAVRQIAEAAQQMDSASAAQESLRKLSERLAALERAEKSAPDKGTVDAGLAELRAAEARSRELAERLARLERENAASAPAVESIAGVAKRLEEVERNAAKSSAGASAGAARAALVLAVGQLRGAVQQGAAFEREFEAVKGMAAGDAGINAALLPLANYAKTGVPTLALLRDEFAAMAGTVVARAGNGNGGWLDRLASSIGALVRVRRTNGAGSDSVEGLVAGAEKQLAAGDLAAAIAALEKIRPLSTEAAKVAQPWLSRAKMRVGAERAVAALHIHAVSLLDAAKE